VTSTSQALWYLVRSTGLVDLVLLTAAMVLGISELVRWTRPGWPRFVVAALHRNVSLLALAVLAVHVVTSIGDSFVNIRLIDAFIPFVGAYQPFWLGLGAFAFDLTLAITITSFMRHRLGLGAWRAVHWGAYVCWPIAVAHGLGMGTDSGAGWVQVLNGVCVAAVVAAVVWRLVVIRRGLSRPGRPHVSDRLPRADRSRLAGSQVDRSRVAGSQADPSRVVR
jgi:methionine sulfoxide reductase heme-binding subunit